MAFCFCVHEINVCEMRKFGWERMFPGEECCDRPAHCAHDLLTTLEICIVSSRRLSSPRNSSRTASLVHRLLLPQKKARNEQPMLVKGKPSFDIVKLIAWISTAANAAGTKHKIEPEGTRGFLRRVLGRPDHSQIAPTASRLMSLRASA